MRRFLAAVSALLSSANGLWMLFGGAAWYAAVPGVTHTGPYNPHFVQDIGARLRDDAIALSDGGGRKIAALNPIIGADKVARFFIGVQRKQAGHDVRVEPAMINGAVGALLYIDGEFDQTISLAIDGEKIAAIYLVRNPDKLRYVAAGQIH